MPGFSTNAIHQGQSHDQTTGAVVPPIYMTSTYAQSWPGRCKGYDYTRAGNPNFTNLEKQLASLESGKYCTVFTSGLSAVTSLCSGLGKGSKVGALKSLYGGSYRLLKRIFEPQGVEIHLVPFGDWEALDTMLREERPVYFMFETPTNPLLEIVDIERVAKLCTKYGVLSVADNTFATPFNQNPLLLGVDVCLHSCTKYLGGHSDVIGGAIITNNKEVHSRVEFNRMAVGLNPSPFDTWLLSRSVKTLAVRMRAHNENAFAVANFLTQLPVVKKVIYPGCTTHPQHTIAIRQMKNGFSGMISVIFKFTLYQTNVFLASCRVFTLGESLGGVESLIEAPASMTHASIPAEERAVIGIEDGLVRLSVGIEDADDLIKDLQQAIHIAQKQANHNDQIQDSNSLSQDDPDA